MRIRTVFLALLLGIGLAGPSLAETYLVMVEEDGCSWCERWNKDISAIYPKTAEGKAAPLRRLDIHDTPPKDMVFKIGLHFTPTFVLMVDGQESARIEGYPGKTFSGAFLNACCSRQA